MQVGDIVKHFLTEQIGIVMTVVSNPRDKEWCSPESLTLLTTA
jgi:hypothetical protein